MTDLVLVTGASGYIAIHIVKQLLEQGYRVRGTVRNLKDEKKCAPLRNLIAKPEFPLELVEANLLDENCWLEAVRDCTYVLHTASPFPSVMPDDENDLIKPAVNGTLNVFKACVQPNSKIKRVVLTSSIAAIFGNYYEQGRTYTESDWSDVAKTRGYVKSKTLAEKAAWEFIDVRKKQNLSCFELAVINPGFVMGPLLHSSDCTSIEVIKRMLERQMPMIPSLYFCCCDVRDVAKAHLNAMIEKEANGKRHIIASTRESKSMQEVALILDKEFGSKGYNVPTKIAPNFLVKFFSLFDKTVRMITPSLGISYNFDNSSMRNVLKIEPFKFEATVIDMANSMIERGFVQK